MLGDVNKFFVFKSLLTYPNVLLIHLKQAFPHIIWIFTEVVGDGIESRLPFKIFSTLVNINPREENVFFFLFAINFTSCIFLPNILVAIFSKVTLFQDVHFIYVLVVIPTISWNQFLRSILIFMNLCFVDILGIYLWNIPTTIWGKIWCSFR